MLKALILLILVVPAFTKLRYEYTSLENAYPAEIILSTGEVVYQPLDGQTVAGIGKEMLYFFDEKRNRPHSLDSFDINAGDANFIYEDEVKYNSQTLTVVDYKAFNHYPEAHRSNMNFVFKYGKVSRGVTQIIHGTYTTTTPTQSYLFQAVIIDPRSTIRCVDCLLCSIHTGLCGSEVTTGQSVETYYKVEGEGRSLLVMGGPDEDLSYDPDKYMPRNNRSVVPEMIGISLRSFAALGPKLYTNDAKVKKRFASLAIAAANSAAIILFDKAVKKSLAVVDANFVIAEDAVNLIKGNQARAVANLIAIERRQNFLDTQIYTGNVLYTTAGELLAEANLKLQNIEKFALYMQTEGRRLSSSRLSRQAELDSQYTNNTLVSSSLEGNLYSALVLDGPFAEGKYTDTGPHTVTCGRFNCLTSGVFLHWKRSGVMDNITNPVLTVEFVGVIIAYNNALLPHLNSVRRASGFTQLMAVLELAGLDFAYVWEAEAEFDYPIQKNDRFGNIQSKITDLLGGNLQRNYDDSFDLTCPARNISVNTTTYADEILSKICNKTYSPNRLEDLLIEVQNVEVEFASSLDAYNSVKPDDLTGIMGLVKDMGLHNLRKLADNMENLVDLVTHKDELEGKVLSALVLACISVGLGVLNILLTCMLSRRGNPMQDGQ